jgi:hypothetical protein
MPSPVTAALLDASGSAVIESARRAVMYKAMELLDLIAKTVLVLPMSAAGAPVSRAGVGFKAAAAANAR